MSFYRKSGGGSVTPSAVRRRSSGSWVNVQNIYRRAGGAWVKVWPGYTVMTVTAFDVNGSTTTGQSNELIGTGNTQVSGGAAPFTYSTVFVSGASFTISGTATATPSFYRAGNPPATFANGVYATTVTDATGASVTKQFTVTDDRSSGL